jgi:phthalate 4,5-cis-dihydrodiol dehydrogenase
MTADGGKSDAIGLGIIGLGMAGAVMVHAAAAQPGYVIQAGADPHQEPRRAFARDHNARAYADAAELCADPAVEAVYIATPHQFHARHAVLAAEHGKHIILEKPMALTLDDCDVIIAAVERHKVHLVVGHTHGFDPANQAMRRIIASGELGRLGMIASFNYTSYLYRPRRPEELDSSKGGGILFNQVPHQVDTVRYLAGGLASSVRAQVNVLDPARPTEAGCMALIQFEGGIAASLTYSGYDHFDSDEWHYGVAESGAPKTLAHGGARRALSEATNESGLRTEQLAYGAAKNVPRPHQPHFGVTIVTCAEGDMRASTDGVLIYGRDGVRELALPKLPGMAGRREVLDEMAAAIRSGRPPLHDGRWGKATVELVLAIQRSAREGCDIALQHQVAVRDPS